MNIDQLKKLLAVPSGPQPILQVLDDWNNDPATGTPMIVLSEYFRNTGKFELANLFTNIYAQYESTRNYDVYAADSERSIIGYYLSGNRKKEGHNICESLSLNSAVDIGRRNMSRFNLAWYSSSLSELIDDIYYHRLTLDEKDGYKELNPSITTWRGELWMIQRTVNYELNSEGHYIPVVDSDIRTRNWLCQLDKNFNIVKKYAIQHPTDWPDPLFGAVLGFEDSRLFVHNDELWTSSTVRELSQNGMAQIVVAKLDMSKLPVVRYSEWHPITPTHTSQTHYEKNWMPVADQAEMSWVYSSDPVRIINSKGETLHLASNWVAADHWRGGSQAIAWRDGWLYVIHETIIPNYKNRRYLHRFVWCDKDWKITKISDALWLKTQGIEFVSGITERDNDLILSFGNLDRESWLAVINSDKLWNMLNNVHDAKNTLLGLGKDYADAWNGTVLLNNQQVVIARNILAQSKLPLHHDTPKNWDNLVSMVNCLTHCKSDEPVLDVGATQESAFLPGLWRCGYTKLISLNLSQEHDELIGGVLYRNGDITKTEYPDNYFGFVACLSVIEHGIDQNLFFAEVSRILRPGGYVCISTDYWKDPIDTTGIQMFNADMTIFTPNDIDKMCKIAAMYGIKLTAKFNPTADQAVIHNLGVNYTFAVLVFQKE